MNVTETKHTPGPWSYGLGYQIRPDRGLDEQGREIGGPTIAEVNADADRCCPPAEEIEANGRLIAAAPDLLAAAKSVAKYVNGRLPMRGNLNDNSASRAALGQLLAAIAKAERIPQE